MGAHGYVRYFLKRMHVRAVYGYVILPYVKRALSSLNHRTPLLY